MTFSKYIIGLIALVLVSEHEFGQGALTSPNMVQDENIAVSGILTDNQIYGLTTQLNQVIRTRKYYDGLGRPIQSVSMNLSPALNDIIKFTSFNNLGQQLYNYLPYVNGNTGNYHSSASTEQTSYYSNGLSDKVVDDNDPWSQKVVESSSLQRNISQGMNGTGFQPTQHFKSANYRSYNPSVYTNDSYNTGVRLWSYSGTSSGAYLTGSLTVMEVTDESGNVTDFYIDATGKLVLKRQIISPQVIDGVTEYCLDTYNIYDDAGELLYIVPPKALVAIRIANANPWNINAASTLIFSFIYDSMGRLVQKQEPGANFIYFIYDPMNRLVLIQDGNLRVSNKWVYLKYDQKQRTISQGIYIDAVNGTSQTTMQNYVNGLSANYSPYYYEEKQTGGAAPNYYTNRIFPTTNQNGSAFQPIAYSYYDNYDFNDDGTADYSYQAQGLTNEATPTSLTRGMGTGSYKVTLNNDGTLNVWLHQVSFYDKRSNPIQVLSNNHTNTAASDTKTIVPDFIGKVMQTKIIKTVNSVATTVLSTFGYDPSNRKSTIDQSNNGGTAIRIAAYVYNELGQLVTKRLHSTDDVNFFQNVDYRYNINGLMTSINNATLSIDNTYYTNSDANDIFGEEILYDKTDASGLGNSSYYNGNISAVKWKDLPPSGNTNERSYLYNYDQLNRLTTAHYSEWNTGGSNWTTAVGYNDENVTKYDHNGNIEGLTRYSSNTLIDNLSYTYSGNQLTNVSDASGNTSGFNGTNAGAYGFDVNGNLHTDPKKGITVSYNILNRTDKILFANNNYIRYTYDGAATVLRKEVYVSSTSTTTTYDYIDGFIYQNSALSYFATAEGRVRNNAGTLTFEYFIRDHLGNVRVSFDGTGSSATVRQENSYYPFGMVLPGNYTPTQPNNDLFNGGSEWQNDFSNLPDFYQTKYRYYDAELGRFIALDPMAEISGGLSPYQFSSDNPISFNDPSGLLQLHYLGPGVFEGSDGIMYDQNEAMEFAFELGGSSTAFDADNPDDGGAAGAYAAINLLIGRGGSISTVNAQIATWIYQASWEGNDQATGVNATNGTNDDVTGYDVSYTLPNGNSNSAFIRQGQMQNYWDQLINLYSDKYNSLAGNLNDVNAGLEWTGESSDLLGAVAKFKGALQSTQKIFNKVGKGFAFAGAALTISDGLSNPDGWQIHNSVDIAATAISFIPGIGQGFALAWFVGNIVSEAINGESLSENIQDAFKNH